MAEPTGAATWSDPDRVEGYLARIERSEPRRAGEQALVEVLPASVDRALDLGCGDGRLAELVRAARPGISEIVCTDASPAMLELARERFVDDTRVQVLDHDMTTSIEAFGTFDVVVSGFAIHHLEHERKRGLFAEIARCLRPGGVFANLEVVASSTPERHEEFLAAIGRPADDPQDRLAPIEQQLDWMRDAGLTQVECIWRWRGFALLVGNA